MVEAWVLLQAPWVHSCGGHEILGVHVDLEDHVALGVHVIRDVREGEVGHDGLVGPGGPAPL